MTIVDAHVHLWDISAIDLPWYTPSSGLSGAYLAAHLEKVAAGVSPVAVCVQAANTAAEASWLLAQATSSRQVAAAVLQYHPSSAGWAGEVHTVIAHQVPPELRGIRVPAHRAAADFADIPGLDGLCVGLAKNNLVLEWLVRPDQLPAVADVARRHPELPMVVCHLGLGPRAPDASWKDGIRCLAEVPTTAAKISGLFSAGSVLQASANHAARDAIAAAYDAFGPTRLMFGSDWPMSTLAGTYASVVETTIDLLPVTARADSDDILHATAMRTYRLTLESP